MLASCAGGAADTAHLTRPSRAMAASVVAYSRLVTAPATPLRWAAPAYTWQVWVSQVLA